MRNINPPLEKGDEGGFDDPNEDCSYQKWYRITEHKHPSSF
jgi:hypothetical protein